MKEQIKYSGLSNYGTMLKQGNITIWKCERCGKIHTMEEFRENEFMLEYPFDVYRRAGNIIFCSQCRYPLYYAIAFEGIITPFLLIDLPNEKKEEIFNAIRKHNTTI